MTKTFITTMAVFLFFFIPSVSATFFVFDGGLQSVEESNPYFSLFGGVATENGVSVLHEGNSARFNVIIKNIGSSGIMTIEGGIYKRDQINQWYGQNVFSTIDQTFNCVSNEDNVQTKTVYLAEGETAIVPITVIVPKPGGYPNEQFGFHAQAFMNCWTASTATGATDYTVNKIKILNVQVIDDNKPSCTDHILNQDETSMDCGGSCEPCDQLAVCVGDNDCQPGLICELSGSQKKCVLGVRQPTTITPPPAPASCGNRVIDNGETCLNCPLDRKDCAEGSSGLNWGLILIVIGVVVIGWFAVRR